jgi:DNA-binding LytR/AlgR family response regulator
MTPTALIAEDEPLLAENLRQELAALWPELQVVAQAGNGPAAVELALRHRPAVCFLDIRMPGLTGLEAAAQLADDWPADGGAFPLIVFVTAYDQYALQAFERAAVDYVLKPVQPARLAQTCDRLRTALAARQAPPDALAAGIAQLQALLGQAAPRAAAPLRLLQVAQADGVLMLPVAEVDYFEAADKYVRVVAGGGLRGLGGRGAGEHLLRISLRELLPQLDADLFWQVHRSVVVRADAIERAVRDEGGNLRLHLHGRPERLPVSRMYAHRFKGL